MDLVKPFMSIRLSWPKLAAVLPARRSHRRILIGGFVFAGLTTVVGVAFSRPAPVTTRIFEIRVIDDSGHPVAGAEVRMGKQELGVTDSFGIWRRNVKIQSDSNVAFDFLKRSRKAGARDLVAKKSFVLATKVDASADSRFENPSERQKRNLIKGSVKMEPVRL